MPVFAAGKTTGISLVSGDGDTHCAAIVDGVVV